MSDNGNLAVSVTTNGVYAPQDAKHPLRRQDDWQIKALRSAKLASNAVASVARSSKDASKLTGQI